VAGASQCKTALWRPAVRGVASGTTSCFISFGSTVAAPVVIGFPLSSLSSTPENFAITPSLKFNLISVGELAAEMFACGFDEVNVGCALAEVPSRLAAQRANKARAI